MSILIVHLLNFVLNHVHVFLTMSLTFLEFCREALCSIRAFFTKQSPFDILCCRRQSRVLLLHVCFCLAKEIPRDRRVHRQLHIDRILQNRQFRSATYITATQICQPERKTVDSRVTRRVLLCFRSRICNNTLSCINDIYRNEIEWRISRRNLYFVIPSLNIKDLIVSIKVLVVLHDILIYFVIHVVIFNEYRAVQLVFIEKLCENNHVKLHATR